MALFNEILSGRFNRALQKTFQLKGGPPSPQLASEIGISWPLFRGAEDRVLEGWYRFGASIVTAATVGVSGVAQLRNPRASNAIVVIERLSFSNATGVDRITVSRGTNDTDLGFNMSLASIDTRSQRTAGATAKATFNNSNAGIPIEFTFQSIGVDVIQKDISIIVTHNQELVLAGGDELKVFSNLNNSVLNVNFIWRERALEDSEFSI